MFDNFFAVIMAGGSGTRLWPLSRKGRPKQSLKIAGDRTLFQRSVDRLLALFPYERILVVTVEEQVALLKKDCPQIPADNYLIEPMPRGTASVVALAAIAVKHRDPNATMAILTADHLIKNAEHLRDLLKAAHKIQRGDTNLDLFRPEPQSDVFFYRERDVLELEKLIVGLAKKFKKERRLFQLITPRNEGPLGVEPLNALLQEALNPPSQNCTEVNFGSFILRKGDRAIIRKNDYQTDTFNGDIGKIVDIVKGRVSIDLDGRIVVLGIDDVRERVRLAYAISVHRSQGQEYPYIILPFINQFGRRMLQRNLLYTALTRAKEKVIVMGHGSAIERAINNASVTKRNTLLGERINKCLLQKKKPSSPPLPEELQNSPDALSEEEQSLSADGEYSPTATTEK